MLFALLSAFVVSGNTCLKWHVFACFGNEIPETPTLLRVGPKSLPTHINFPLLLRVQADPGAIGVVDDSGAAPQSIAGYDGGFHIGFQSDFRFFRHKVAGVDNQRLARKQGLS